MPSCPPGFHEGQVSTLLGGLTTAPSGPTCLRDSSYDAFDLGTIVQTVANIALPVLNVPGFIQPAATRLPDQFETAIGLSQQEQQYVDLGVKAL